jgi:polar amino acid transport system substrate-binding protein
MSLPASPTRTRRSVRGTAALGVAAVLAGLGACAPSDTGTTTTTPAATGSSSATTDACAKDQLKVRTPGKLTIGTDKPAYSPWFVDDDPTSGKGFESAVAYAVAEKLGFGKADVTWTVAAFNTVIAPGPKPFDVDVNQVSITEERRKNVDFSSGYYDVAQALVTVKGSKVAGAKGIADLKGAKLGAQVGTTSYRTITEVIKPDAAPAVFDKNDDAKLALGNGQVDGIVVDLPTALYLAAAEIKDGVVAGQFEAGGTPEQFGMVLDKGSALTACVSKAVDALRADGTLDKLETEWLTKENGAPVLK